MVSFRVLALLAAAAVVTGQDVSTLEPCGQTCVANTKAQFAKYNCPSADDVACLCKAGDFKNGVEDCSKQACTDPAYSGTVLAAVNLMCEAALAAPAPVPSTTPPAPSTPAPTPTPAPAPTTSSTSSSSSSTSVTESAAKLTSSTTTSSTSSATKTASSSSSSTVAAAPAATTTSAGTAPAQGPPEGSLSTATKIGIGVGCVAAAAALIGVAICALLRRRQNKRDIGAATKSWKISEPMPVSGPAYGHDYSNSYETGLSDLEMKSRRYEDMLPRQVPRQMV